MKKIILLPIVVIMLFLSYSSNAANDFQITRDNVAKQDIKLDKYDSFAINQNDSSIECYRKLLYLNHCYCQKMDNVNILNFWVENANIAYIKYPGCRDIVANFAIARFIKNEKTNSGAEKEMLVSLIPFVHDNDANEVFFDLFYLFYYMENNLSNKNNSKCSKIICDNDSQSVSQRIKVMEQYWASKISDEFLNSGGKFCETIKNVKKKNVNVDPMEVAKIWCSVINNCYSTDKSELSIKIRNEIMMEKAIEQSEQEKRKETEKRLFYEKVFKENLDELKSLEELPINVDKLEPILSRLSSYYADIIKYEHVPNYESLMKIYKGTENAQIIDVAFKIFSQRKFKDGLDSIADLKCKDSNTFVLLLKAQCLYNMNKPVSEILGVVNRILEIEPDNKRAKMMKVGLEK